MCNISHPSTHPHHNTPLVVACPFEKLIVDKLVKNFNRDL